MGKNNEELNRYQASKSKNNARKSAEIPNEERHSKNALKSAIEQEYPRIDTENL